MINEVIIGEPECSSLEIALLSIRIYHVAEVANLVLHVRTIAPLAVVLVELVRRLTLILAITAAIFGASVMMFFLITNSTFICAHLSLS